jgi:hypothetical protein
MTGSHTVTVRLSMYNVHASCMLEGMSEILQLLELFLPTAPRNDSERSVGITTFLLSVYVE